MDWGVIVGLDGLWLCVLIPKAENEQKDGSNLISLMRLLVRMELKKWADWRRLFVSELILPDGAASSTVASRSVTDADRTVMVIKCQQTIRDETHIHGRQ